MTAVPAWVPFDEMDVKNPGSWPVTIAGSVLSMTRVTLGEVWIFQMLMVFPALLTTRPTPSDLLKKDSAHQHALMGKVARTLSGPPGVNCPKFIWFRRNIRPSLPRATARFVGPASVGMRSTPPELRSESVIVFTFDGVKKSITWERSLDILTTLSDKLLTLS